MKNFLLGVIALTLALPAAANLDGNGYYRVQNYKTKRYAYVTDNKGQVNWTATTADVGAIQLWKGFLEAASDPATIIYIEKHGSGRQYDLIAQGTSVSKFLDYYPSIQAAPKNRNTYVCYATRSGMTKYLGDIDLTDDAQGTASVDATGEDREWYIEQLGTADDNYFGVKPTLTVGQKYYYPLYTGFPMTPFSDGVKFYTVEKIDGEYAVLKALSGTVPASTPIIVECDHPLAIDNKISIGGTGVAVGTNQLGGVYFCNTSKSHRNVTAYNASTMRVLGKDASGNLAFVKASDLEYLPANQSYLKVPSSAPATLRLVTPEQYEQLRYEAKEIKLDRTSWSGRAGSTLKLAATLTPADAKTSLTWSSSNPAVATVDNEGNVKLLATGTANITVTTENGLSASCSVEVYTLATEITLNENSLSMRVGDRATLTATVTPADARDAQVTWSSENPAVATVEADGTVRAVATGNTRIVASLSSGLRAECAVEVYTLATAISLSENSLSMPVGDHATLHATVSPADARDAEVSWTSENTDVATVEEDGTVHAIATGNTRIIASLSSGLKAVCDVEVYTLATAISISTEELTLTEGDTFTLIATVTPTDARDAEVTWSSEDAAVATVDAEGRVTAVAPGRTRVVASLSSGLNSACFVIVEKRYVDVTGIALNLNSLSLTEGQTATLQAVVTPTDATEPEVTWISRDENVAIVADGIVTAVAPGTTTIEARAGDFTASCSVEVRAAEIPVIYPEGITLSWTEASLEAGSSLLLEATVTPDDATDKSITFISMNPLVATVDADGTVTGVAKGTTTITATTSNGITATAAVHVFVALAGIEVNPSSVTAEEGSECDLTVFALPAEAELPEVTWNSSNEAVASVDAEGHVKILGEGTAVITATAGDFSATCVITGISGLSEILTDGGVADIYDVQGRLVRRNADAEDVKMLSRGMYIVNGKKIIR